MGREAPFPIVRVAGDPVARGRAYGRASRDRIERSLAFYRDAIPRTGRITFAEAIEVVRANEPVWGESAPDVLAEIHGVAEGAGLPVEPLLVLNARDTFMHRHQGSDTAREFDDGCTSFCVLPGSSADGHVWSGQNWDYHPDIRDTVVLLHVNPDGGPAQLWIVEAGQVGRQGVNTAGVALQANGLPSEHRDEAALPGPIARRRILASTSWDQALARALETPRAGRTNLLLTSRDGRAADVEGSYATSRLSVAEGDGWMTHANHFQLGAPPDLIVDRGPSSESVARSASAHRAIAAAGQRGGVALEDLMSLARSHEDRTGQVCDHGKLDPAWMTVASTVTDLTDGITYVAAGPPCEHPFVAIDVESGRVRSVASDALR